MGEGGGVSRPGAIVTEIKQSLGALESRQVQQVPELEMRRGGGGLKLFFSEERAAGQFDTLKAAATPRGSAARGNITRSPARRVFVLGRASRVPQEGCGRGTTASL